MALQLSLQSGVMVPLADIQNSRVFRCWVERLGPGWAGKVVVTHANYWGNQVHSLQLLASPVGDPWMHLITLRSPTVDVLVRVTDGTPASEHVVFVEQYRVAIGGNVISNVAGGLDWGEGPLEAAMRESQEELGFEADELLALRPKYRPLLDQPVLASPGMIDEETHLVELLIHLLPQQLPDLLSSLSGRRTGLEIEGERLQLHVVAASRARAFLLDQPHLDAKTLLSLGLAGL